MSQAGAEPESLKGYLDYTFQEYESLYEIETRGNSPLATRLIEIIKTAYNKTGKNKGISGMGKKQRCHFLCDLPENSRRGIQKTCREQ